MGATRAKGWEDNISAGGVSAGGTWHAPPSPEEFDVRWRPRHPRLVVAASAFALLAAAGVIAITAAGSSSHGGSSGTERPAATTPQQQAVPPGAAALPTTPALSSPGTIAPTPSTISGSAAAATPLALPVHPFPSAITASPQPSRPTSPVTAPSTAAFCAALGPATSAVGAELAGRSASVTGPISALVTAADQLGLPYSSKVARAVADLQAGRPGAAFFLLRQLAAYC